jgi:indolepyruvate ferredoxin oxidoreductase alpha subunit
MHTNVHEKLKKLETFASRSKLNRIEWGDKGVGIITSGTPYQYLKEILPEASYLKLGLTYPLSRALIEKFAGQVADLYVIEELEPFLEDQIAAMGLNVKGQVLRPPMGALSVEILSDSLAGVLKRYGKKQPKRKPPLPQVITRFPTLCAGCIHLAVYYAIRGVQKKMKDREIVLMGDIGCYSLGIAAPHNMLACAFAMGSGISSAHGLSHALDGNKGKAILSYIGDSTFFHAGMPALLNAVYNKSSITAIIADNRTTAMTGGQEHAGTGVTLGGDYFPPAQIAQVCRVLGVKDIHEVDPYDYAKTSEALKKAIEFEGLSTVIATSACRMFPKKLKEKPFKVLSDLCTGCGMCLSIYCPAMIVSGEKTEKGKSKAAIDPFMCAGCSFCAQVCPVNAIVGE